MTTTLSLVLITGITVEPIMSILEDVSQILLTKIAYKEFKAAVAALENKVGNIK